MIKSLYDVFKHWSEKGSVYLYSDPHFGDADSYKFRSLLNVPDDIMFAKEQGDSRPYELYVEERLKVLDEMQIKNINKRITKNDTIIFLGDIGDIECIKQINGYKVLITGNHDKGVSNYKRVERFEKIDVSKYLDGKTPNELCIELSDEEREQYYEEARKKAEREYEVKPDFIKISNRINYGFHSPFMSWYAYFDNHLFDEVYSGPLMISDRIILSHEPITPLPIYLFNIHGHDHSGKDFMEFVPKHFDCDISSDDLADVALAVLATEKCPYFNCCAEWIGYTPVNLNKIIKSGIMSQIPDIHRQYIDKRIA